MYSRAYTSYVDCLQSPSVRQLKIGRIARMLTATSVGRTSACQSRRFATSSSTTTPIGIANATAVRGRVIAIHATQLATATSHRRDREPRHSSSAHQPRSQSTLVVVSALQLLGKRRFDVVGSQRQTVSTATQALDTRLTRRKRSAPAIAESTIGISPGSESQTP